MSTMTTKRPHLFVVDNSGGDYLEDLHARLAQSRAIEHPVLNQYARNGLSREQERLLFSECYYWLRDLPYFVSLIGGLTKDPRVLRELPLNIYDAVGPDKSFQDAYLSFLSAIGLSREIVRQHGPAEQSLKLNGVLGRAYSRLPLETALGAFYFDELMVRLIAGKLCQGLKNGGHPPAAYEFWERFSCPDYDHQTTMFNAIYPYISEEDDRREKFEKGVFNLQAAVENYWDSVAHVIGLEELLPA